MTCFSSGPLQSPRHLRSSDNHLVYVAGATGAELSAMPSQLSGRHSLPLNLTDDLSQHLYQLLKRTKKHFYRVSVTLS